jgi:RimJ/RimL family protein N-acetyltransferase
MNILETDRLVLRQLTTGDAEFILDLLNQPSFLRNIGDRHVRNLQDAENYIRTGPMASYAQHGFGLFLVELKDDHSFIGICGLIKRETLQDIDLGFAYLPQYWSQGYAFEAASAVMSYGKDVIKLKRIVAVVSPKNERSIHLLEKIGLKFERMMTWPDDSFKLKLYSKDVENKGLK